jgi:leucyl-tRNA synthetase
VVSKYGADAVRAYLMFMGPFDQGGPWSDQGIEGVWRYLNRVWTLVTETLDAREAGEAVEAPAGVAVERLRHKTIARVTGDYSEMRFNTALAAMMECVNGLNKAREESPEVVRDERFQATVETLLVLLAPFTPHIAEELWHEAGHSGSVHLEAWPEFDPALTVDEVVTLVVQVNGKVRDKLEVSPNLPEGEARALALASPKVQASLEGRKVRKFIYVAERYLANIVG